MFTFSIKGHRDPRDAEMVKLSIVFYKTGCTRVPKILNITGLYSDWNSKTRQFKPNSADNITKNRLFSMHRGSSPHRMALNPSIHSGSAWRL